MSRTPPLTFASMIGIPEDARQATFYRANRGQKNIPYVRVIRKTRHWLVEIYAFSSVDNSYWVDDMFWFGLNGYLIWGTTKCGSGFTQTTRNYADQVMHVLYMEDGRKIFNMVING